MRKKGKVNKEPWELTKSEFRLTAEPLVDKVDFMNMTLYNNPLFSNLKDGFNIIPNVLDCENGITIVYIDANKPIGTISVYNGIMKNIAVAENRQNKGICHLLIAEAIRYGANEFENRLSPEIVDIAHEFYVQMAKFHGLPISNEVLKDYKFLC